MKNFYYIILFLGYSLFVTAQNTEGTPIEGVIPVKGINTTIETPVDNKSKSNKGNITSKTAAVTTTTAPTGTSTEVGITEGQLSVSLSGGASYSVPIAVPPGINGVVPQVGLVYNSQGSNGIAGYGWNISGVSAITRIPRTKFHDGVVGGVNLDANDRFALDGQRLILKSGVYGANNTEYETENFSNVKITAVGVSPLGASYGPASFLVEYPDGSKAEYGATNDSRSKIIWSITYWENPQGIRISYSYIPTNNNLNIEYIKYGNTGTNTPINQVKFIYKTRTRPEQSYIGGESVITDTILSEIKTIGNGAGFRNYFLAHDETPLRYERLISITEKNGDGSTNYNPTVFSYDNTPLDLTTKRVDLFSNEQVSIANNESVSGDFNGDGFMDYILYPKSTKTKFTLYDNLRNATVLDVGYTVNIGYFYDIFPSNWVMASGKVASAQGITAIHPINSPEGNIAFKTYSFSAPFFYGPTTRIVSFPTYTRSGGCREYYSGNQRGCEEITAEEVIGKKYLSGDFNGDGLTDVIAIDNTTYFNSYCDSNDMNECYTYGENYQIAPKEVYFVDLKQSVTTDYLKHIGTLQNKITYASDVRVIDFNGDGRSDFMIRENGSVFVYTMSQTNVLVLLASKIDPDILLDRQCLVGDYNGDGKTDFITPKYAHAYDHHTEWCKFTSTGTIFIKEEQNYPGVVYYPVVNPDPNYNASMHNIAIDYNNDGKTDIVTFFCSSPYVNATNVKFSVMYNINGSFTYTPAINQTLIYSGIQAGFDIYSIPIFYNSNQSNQKLEVALMRNNKILYFQSQKDFSSDKLLKSITTGNGVKESITYKPLMYDTSQDDMSVYTPVLYTSNYPNADIAAAPSFQVVSTLEKQSASVYKKQLFAYAGATSNMEGLGFLGFRASMRTNWFEGEGQIISSISKSDPNLRGANIENYTYLGLTYPEVAATQSAANMYRPKDVIVDYSVINDYDTVLATKSIRIVPGVTIAPGTGNTFIARITPDYDSTGFAETNTSPPYGLITKSLSFYEASLSASKVYTLQNVQSKNYNILDNTSSETEMSYDTHNNPVESVTKLKNGGVVEQTSTNIVKYVPAPNLGSPIVSRPDSKTQTVTSSGDSITTKETYGYGTGTESNLLKKIEKWGNNTGSIKEENIYDTYGNITLKTITAGSISRVTSYEYTIAAPYNGRFLTKSTDIEGLSTIFDYNPNNGLLNSETNPYNLTTTYTYNDSWFKKTKTTDYLGKSNTYAYARSQNINTLVTTTGDDGSYSEELFDDLGRKIRTGVKDLQDHMSYKDFQYDIYDRNYNVSEPHTGSPSLWNTTVYDVYGRPETVTSMTGKVISMAYGELTTTVIDNSTGKTKKSTKNAIGNVVKMEENPGGIVNYSYFANGNLKETDYAGTKITITQDGWGRKTSLTDPSAGVYTYEYNALGEMTKETTPNGFTTYNLDPWGKLETKTIFAPTKASETKYTYNTLPNNKLLKQTEYTDFKDAGKKITTDYTYDAQKRLVSSNEATDYGAVFTKTIDYDLAWGRVDKETSTATLNNNQTSTTVIQNEYKNGVVYKIKDYPYTQTLWEAKEVNARGQLTKATLGNGITIDNTYNDKGYVTNMKHSQGSTIKMELGTVFDIQRGNLMSRTNSLFGTNDAFEYDLQDRLTKYPNALGIPVDQSYEDDGRIKENTLGKYIYKDSAKKYRNTSIELNPEATGYYASREGIFSDSMEDKKGWAIPNPIVYTYDTTEKHSGNNSLKIANTTTGEQVIHAESWVKIDNTAPTYYTYSAWVKSDAPQAELVLFMKTETETNYFTLIDSKFTNVTNQWVRIEGTFEVPAIIKKLNLRLDNNGTGNIWFDDVMIRKTSNAALVNKQIPDADYKDRQLHISYNAFKSPIEIKEDGVDKISFIYNDNNDRSAMFYGSLDIDKNLRPNRKYYSADGSMEIKQNIQTGEVEFVTYIAGDGYSAPVVYKKNYDSTGAVTQQQYLYLHRDYQGSILAITDTNGVILEKRLFDAWGAIVKVQDGAGNVLNGFTILDRGYTGHEHLQSVGLINMNGRIYDPKLHRFLQPDNYVQDPYNTQNFNRYGYCWNNPFKYTDPSGEWIWIVVAAVVGGVINWAVHGAQFNMEGLKAFGIGAAAGTIGALTGGAAFAAAGGAAGGVGGALAGAAGGAVGAATSQTFLTMGNHVAFGDPIMSGKEFITGIAFGAVLGGATNGISALRNGRTFWKGTLPHPQVSPISLPSVGIKQGQAPEIKSDAKLPSTTQTSTAPTTEANTTGKVTFTKNVDGNGYKVEGLGIKENGVITVTKDGVALPQGAKIPSELIENPYRSSSFGIMKEGKFIETLRIDAATPPGFKGPNQSHFHLNNGGHIFDQSKWPWW